MAQNGDWAGSGSTELPPELVTQLAEAVSKAAHRYEMMGRPRDAVRVLQTALSSGRQTLQPRDRERLVAALGAVEWRQGCCQAATCGPE
jgi:hypothetical protein